MTFVLKNIQYVVFKDRIMRMRAAFRAACAPFYAELEALEKDGSEFQKQVDAGTARWSEHDEETGASWDYGDQLAERRSDAEDALLTLRKAFAIMSYHLWERGAQRWAAQKKKGPNHRDLIAALTASGIVVGEKKLGELNKLVNCLKHNSASSGPALYTARPDFFDSDFDPLVNHPATGKPLTRIDWAENILLSDANIEEFLMAALSSAPK
jgi:hypothetical protein